MEFGFWKRLAPDAEPQMMLPSETALVAAQIDMAAMDALAAGSTNPLHDAVWPPARCAIGYAVLFHCLEHKPRDADVIVVGGQTARFVSRAPASAEWQFVHGDLPKRESTGDASQA